MHIYTDEIERLRGSIVTRNGKKKKKIAVVSGDRSLNGFVVLSRQWREGGYCVGACLDQKRGKCDYRANKLKVYSYGGHLFVCVLACLTGKSFWLQI